MTDPNRLDLADQAQLSQVLACCPELQAAAGQVRQMYGRAGFDLLRRRVLLSR